MGKLHKIRKAFEQLPEDTKKKMALSAYSWCVVFNNNRAIITKTIPQPKGYKFRAHWPFLRALLVRFGYKKVSPKPYTRTEKTRVTYQNYRPKNMIKHKAST